MNLHELVESYVDFRRGLGEKCITGNAVLRSFCHSIGSQISVRQITVKKVTAFVAGKGPVTRAWHVRYAALKGFFQFAVGHGHLHRIPLPMTLPKRPPTVVPYVYSRAELWRLLNAISSFNCPRLLERATLRAMLLVAYGAGLRRQELLNLKMADVDVTGRLLTIRDTKFFKSRLVPIGRDLAGVLGRYLRQRKATHRPTDASDPFFITREAESVSRWTLDQAYSRLRRFAGVQRADGGRFQPRLHDLRHTFAVHRLTSWYEEGADVQRLLYHLSVYLGHTNLAHTQVYLTMTPELLTRAGRRFERYAHGEVSDD